MSYVKMKTVSFDFEGLREEKKDAKCNDADKRSGRQVISLPKTTGNEFVKGRLEKERSKNHKKIEEMTPRTNFPSSSLLKFSNAHGVAGNLRFPTPVTTSKEIREALERMKTSYRISASQRSFSAPNVMNESSVAKQRRQKSRFPLLAQRKDDVTARNCSVEKLVVVGKKVSESSAETNQAEEITAKKENPSDEGESVEKQEKKVDEDDFILRISFHDNQLSSFYANRLSELPLVFPKSFRPLYSESSVSFNAYLRSRFGRSVYVREGNQSESLDKMKHCPLDWAPLIIKKQDLSRRNHVLPEKHRSLILNLTA